MDRELATKCFEALVEETRSRIRSDAVRLEAVECPARVPARGFSLCSDDREVTVCFHREGDRSQPHLVGPFLLIYVGTPDAPLRCSDYCALHFWDARLGERWTTDLSLTGYIDRFGTLPSGEVVDHTFTNAELAVELLKKLRVVERPAAGAVTDQGCHS